MLADLSGDNGIALGHCINLLTDELRHQFSIRLLGVLQWILLLPLSNLRQPLTMRTTPVLRNGPEFFE
jgi:hypothetical protein